MPLPNGHTIQATGAFLTAYEGYAKFARDWAWSGQRFVLEETSWPLLDFDPSVVCWKRSGEAIPFWPKPRQAQKKRAKEGPEGPKPLADDADSSKSEGGSHSNGTDSGDERGCGGDGGDGLSWEEEMRLCLEELMARAEEGLPPRRPEMFLVR